MSAAGGLATLLGWLGRAVVEFAQQREMRVVLDRKLALLVLGAEHLRHLPDELGDAAVLVVEGRRVGHGHAAGLVVERGALDALQLADLLHELRVKRLAVDVRQVDHRTTMAFVRAAGDEGAGDQLTGVPRLQYLGEGLLVHLAQERRAHRVVLLPEEGDHYGAARHDLAAAIGVADETLEPGESPVDEGLDLFGHQWLEVNPHHMMSPVRVFDAPDDRSVRHVLTGHDSLSCLHVRAAL